MENKVAATAVTSDPVLSAPARHETESPRKERRVEPTQDAADLRLVIEEDSASGSYVYKTIDRRTGKIVAQLPRDDVLKMHEEKHYSAGDVIDARA